MELNDSNFQTLAHYLQQTLNPDSNVRKPAEDFLQSIECNQNYSLLLLHLINKDEIDLTIRVAGAIVFKNFVKRNWKIEEGVEKIHEQDRLAVKSFIVTLMLKAPLAVQKQLSDAVSIIGRYDFPKKWPQLLDEMITKFSTGDFHVINGVLQTGHSLFKKYRYEFKSQELWEEIKFVLDKLCYPLTDLLNSTITLADTHSSNSEALKIIYSSLVIISKIFYSLNFQDLPEFFEDNMEIWMGVFLKLLKVDIPCLKTSGDEEVGVIENLRSQICDNLGLYAQKYDEEFQPYMAQFVSAIWELLCNTGTETKYDTLVSKALQFLSIVADRKHYKDLFLNSQILASICEKIAIPNITFRDSDQEMFEDNPEEYIRRDIEGSDVDTRRRSACDLVKTLSQKFEKEIFAVFAEYVNVLLGEYKANPKNNWKAKDTVIYLVTSMASRGATEKHGVTQSSELVPIPMFCKDEIIGELNDANINNLPVIKADCIKFIMTFRTILGPEFVTQCIPLLIKHLQSQSAVVHTYAACAIDKILIMKNSNGKSIITKEMLTPFGNDLFNSLFTLLTIPQREENEYVMKTIMRSFSVLQNASMPFMGVALPQLTEILKKISKNPTKPHFNHYLFETLSLCIKIVCSLEVKSVTSFEEILFPVFQSILQQDIVEFIPYVFQLIYILLEYRGEIGEISNAYWELFPCLLVPDLWERSGNVTPLVRLICTYIKLGSIKIAELNKLNPILGIFQKLAASKQNDHEGFYLLQNLILYYPSAQLKNSMQQIFVVLFQRLMLSKTTKYVRGLVIFICFCLAKIGPSEVIEIIDNIQREMFGMVIKKLLVTDIGRVSEALDKKIVAVGMTKLLCECPILIKGQYETCWAILLEALIQLFELPTDNSNIEGDHFIEIEDTPGYQVTYAQLNYAQPKPNDPFIEITDPRTYLVQSLAKVSQQNPGLILGLISTVSMQHQQALQKYCTQSGVQIN